MDEPWPHALTLTPHELAAAAAAAAANAASSAPRSPQPCLDMNGRLQILFVFGLPYLSKRTGYSVGGTVLLVIDMCACPARAPSECALNTVSLRRAAAHSSQGGIERRRIPPARPASDARSREPHMPARR